MSQCDTEPVGCTLTVEAELTRALVLARSHRRHHPARRFVVGLLDGPDDTARHGHPADGDGVTVLGADRLGLPRTDLHRLATAYPPAALVAAVKPLLVRRLLDDGAPVVGYLDAGCWVLADLTGWTDLAARHGVVVTPHLTGPAPADLADFAEAGWLGGGRLNPGVLAFGPAARPLLDHWAECVLRLDALDDSLAFAEQRWLDAAAPAFGAHECTDPGLNLGPWNAFQRPVDRDAGGGYRAGGAPLRLVAFAGYRPETAWLLADTGPTRPPRLRLSQHPALRALADEYASALRAAGFDPTERDTPSWLDRLPDGTPITPLVRRLYRDAVRQARHARTADAPPDAFTDGGRPFRDWLVGPVRPITPEHARTGLARWPLAVWQDRVDLRQRFPDPGGADRAGFREWCRTCGRDEGELAAWAAPAAPTAATPPDPEFGVNVVGHLTADLGVGELGRTLLDAVTTAGIPATAVVEDQLVVNRLSRAAPAGTNEPRFGVSLLCVNADLTDSLTRLHPAAVTDRYRIGVWSWELDTFPAPLHPAFDLVDEVWTISEFCRRALAAVTDRPVRTIPLPVRDPGEPRRPAREPDRPTRFLFAFDYNSVAERKNPWGVVTAFQRAFPGRADVRLVLKTINAEQHFRVAERLRAAVAGDDRIDVLEHYLSVAELDELYAASDCYVSLHRAEGFGFTVAEAMARALPVICTDYSGTREFTDPDCCWPIGWRSVPVGPDAPPYPPDAHWAEPDLDAAAAAMREVADDPALAAKRGRAARDHVLRTRGAAATARWVDEHLRLAHRTWSDRAGAGPTAGGPPAPTRRPGSTATRWPRLAALAGKAVLRVIDHYDVHQRRLLDAVADGARDATGRGSAGLHGRVARWPAADRPEPDAR